MGEMYPPTGADYAMHAARETKTKTEALEKKVELLEQCLALILDSLMDRGHTQVQARQLTKASELLFDSRHIEVPR